MESKLKMPAVKVKRKPKAAATPPAGAGPTLTPSKIGRRTSSPSLQRVNSGGGAGSARPTGHAAAKRRSAGDSHAAGIAAPGVRQRLGVHRSNSGHDRTRTNTMDEFDAYLAQFDTIVDDEGFDLIADGTASPVTLDDNFVSDMDAIAITTKRNLARSRSAGRLPGKKSGATRQRSQLRRPRKRTDKDKDGSTASTPTAAGGGERRPMRTSSSASRLHKDEPVKTGASVRRAGSAQALRERLKKRADGSGAAAAGGGGDERVHVARSRASRERMGGAVTDRYVSTDRAEVMGIAAAAAGGKRGSRDDLNTLVLTGGGSASKLRPPSGIKPPMAKSGIPKPSGAARPPAPGGKKGGIPKPRNVAVASSAARASRLKSPSAPNARRAAERSGAGSHSVPSSPSAGGKRKSAVKHSRSSGSLVELDARQKAGLLLDVFTEWNTAHGSGTGLAIDAIGKVANVIMGRTLAAHELEVLFQMGDMDGDGIINEDEWLPLMRDVFGAESMDTAQFKGVYNRLMDMVS